MLKIILCVGVLAVKVAIVCQQFLNRDLPGVLVLDAGVPPVDAGLELLKLHWLGLAITVATLWQGDLVVPDPFCTGRLLIIVGGFAGCKEENVGGDARVGREGADGQAHDGMQVELGEQLLLDDAGDAVAEEEAIGQHHAAASGGSLQMLHDVLEEEQSSLGGAHAIGEVIDDAALLLAAEGWIGGDDIDAVAILYVAQVDVGEGVALLQVGRFDAVQQHIHDRQQVGHGLLLDAMYVVLQLLAQLRGACIVLQATVCLDEKAAGTAGWI